MIFFCIIILLLCWTPTVVLQPAFVSPDDLDHAHMPGMSTLPGQNSFHVATLRSGLLVTLPHDDTRVSDSLRIFGEYERPSMVLVCRMLSKILGVTLDEVFAQKLILLDVGSNVGAWTLHFAQSFTESKIFAFEVQRKLNMLLSCSLAMNNLSNVYLMQAGISVS